jgi:large subunit ribosomal protein L4
MIELQVYTKGGDKSDVLNVDEARMGAKVRKRLLHDAVVMYEANQRLGTQHARGRSEKAGSKAKLFRQKGTGRARVGNARTNKRVGGGVAFGIGPRDYSYSINRRAKKEALKSALLGKLRDGEVLVIEDLAIEKPKTKEIRSILDTLGIEAGCLIVLEDYDKNVYLSARNIKGAKVMKWSDLNAYDVLRFKNLLLTRAAADVLFGK